MFGFSIKDQSSQFMFVSMTKVCVKVQITRIEKFVFTVRRGEEGPKSRENVISFCM